jgi:hypothetical protein
MVTVHLPCGRWEPCDLPAPRLPPVVLPLVVPAWVVVLSCNLATGPSDPIAASPEGDAALDPCVDARAACTWSTVRDT